MTPDRATRQVLRSATLPGGSRADVILDRGTVASVVPAVALDRSADRPHDEYDLDGWLLLPAPAEPHAHLDKALTGDLGTTGNDLMNAVRAWTAHAPTVPHGDFVARALAALDILVGNGVTAVRTHVNPAAGDHPMRPIEALLEVRDRVREVVHVEIAVLARPKDDQLVRDALAAGVDLVGGAPHSSSDPAAELARLLRLATAAGVPVDLHTDEQLDAELSGLADLAHEVIEGRFTQRATASHCVALGMKTGAEQELVAALVAKAGVGVVACPMTNLALQARDRVSGPPRGITALRALLRAGATVCAGTDNLRDPFNPVGRGDPLEIASLLVTAGHLSVTEAYAAVSSSVRLVMGLPVAGPQAGAVADLLAVRARDLTEAVAAAPADRLVWRAGRLVASSRTSRTTALSAPEPGRPVSYQLRRAENPLDVSPPDKALSSSLASWSDSLPGLRSP